MLARLLLIGAILCCISIPVVGQDDLYVPKPSDPSEEPVPKPVKPPPAPGPDEAKLTVRSLVGTWDVVHKGNPTCGSGILVLEASGRSGVSGYTQFGKFRGDVQSLALRGREMSFNNNYIDALGNPEMVVWRGNVSEDGSTVSGRLEGSWQNGCTLIMRRR